MLWGFRLGRIRLAHGMGGDDLEDFRRGTDLPKQTAPQFPYDAARVSVVQLAANSPELDLLAGRM